MNLTVICEKLIHEAQYISCELSAIGMKEICEILNVN